MTLVFVPKCVGCGERLERDDLFCEKCYSEYLNARQEDCPVCHSQIDRCTCAPAVMRRMGLGRYIKLMRYRTGEDTPVNRIAYELKNSHNRKLTDFLALELALPIKRYIGNSDKSEFAVTYCPRSDESVSRFGYDHMEEVARKTAEILGVDFEYSIVRTGGRIQKKSGRKERRENARESFAPTSSCRLGSKYFLLDDIVTTGATMEACKNILKKNGAKDVICVSIFQAIKDKC